MENIIEMMDRMDRERLGAEDRESFTRLLCHSQNNYEALSKYFTQSDDCPKHLLWSWNSGCLYCDNKENMDKLDFVVFGFSPKELARSNFRKG